MAKTLSGNLDTFSLADLLQWLEINRLSGRVTIRRGEVTRAIDLKKGAIVYVSSTRPDERLGVFLAGRSLLPEEAVYELLAENFATGRNLTRIILDHGVLEREALAEAVEGLATQVLLDLFHWPGAVFEFDPSVKTEDILRVQLSLRGQVLAFHAAKSVDDSARIRLTERTDPDIHSPWEREFAPDALAATFWTILEGLSPEAATAETVRERFDVFHRFAESLRARLLLPQRPFPIYDDTALMLQHALAQDADDEHLGRIAALDPFLTADLLYLANALRLSGREALAETARDAVATVGGNAARIYLGHLSSPNAVTAPSADRLERAVRRTALATAVAASNLAEAVGLDAEVGYTLGLLEPLAAYEPLRLVLATDFEPGPFRAAVLAEFRTVHGRVLARKLSLPRQHAALFGSTGRVTGKSPASEQLVFLARKFFPNERIGRELESDDEELLERHAHLAQDPELTARVSEGVGALRELLNL